MPGSYPGRSPRRSLARLALPRSSRVRPMSRLRLLSWALLAGCAGAKPAPTVPAAPPPRLHPEETAHLSDLRQLTFGGENAEAYWSFDGKQLSFQARGV